MNTVRKLLAGSAILALVLIGTTGAVQAICGDCTTIDNNEWCVASDPNFAFCRYWYEYEIIWIPGDCASCLDRFVRVVHQKCEAYIPCAY